MGRHRGEVRTTAWAKLDDNFWMHPSILTAGNAGAGIFARMLSYSGCYLTDGLVPSAIVQSIVGKDKAALTELERMGVLNVLDSGSVHITDYLEYNRSKQEVEADRQTRRQNGARGGRPKANGTHA